MWREWSDATTQAGKKIQKEVKADLGKESGNGDDIIHGCKVLKELIEPWHHTHRVVCADSYFASVSTAKELMRLGMRFIGVVKTSSKQFPMAYLQELEFEKRGEWKVLRNATISMYAFVWFDCNRRYFINNTSSLSHGTPYTRVQKRQVAPIESQEPPVQVEFTINQPKAAEMYYNTYGKIDHHNMRRHETLRLERKVKTNDWYKQVNQIILGMIVFDAFLCYNQLVDESEKEGDFYLRLDATELNHICCQLVLRPILDRNRLLFHSRQPIGCSTRMY